MKLNLQTFVNLFGYIIFSCFILITSSSNAKETVPVLIWDGLKPPIESPAVSAFPIPASHLEGRYLKNFDSSNILLFLLDSLSVEDLSSHECVFKHVSKWMENSHSLYLPAVETKYSLQHALSSQDYNVVNLLPGSSIGGLKLDKDAKNLVVVKLPPTDTNPSRQKALQKADEVIGNVLSKIGKSANFTVIFSGIKPSLVLDNEIAHKRVARDIPTQKFGDPKFYYTQCVILYLRNDIILYKGNSSLTLKADNTTLALPDCGEDTAAIMINFRNVGEYKKLKVGFNFVRTARRWTMVNANLTVMVQNEPPETATLTPIWQMEDVPLNKSYACTRPLTFLSNETDSDKKNVYKMKIDGIQVQAFSNKQTRFSDGWDCVGFFTIPIWTGIIAGVIMVLILLVGLFMLSDVKTMDRFDDPKGAHIAVTGSNE